MAREGSESARLSRPRQDSTAALLVRVRGGDLDARAQVVARYLPALKRIAHGRLPARSRGPTDTDDLVQTTLLRALNRFHRFELRHEGAFLAYLRQIMVNQIRDEVRRASRMGQRVAMSEDLVYSDQTPLQQAIGRETLEAYDSALSRLKSTHRQAIILRLELGFDYVRLAEALGLSSANAARLLVSRALLRLASHLRKFKDAQ